MDNLSFPRACPVCEVGIMKTLNYMLTSNPPKTALSMYKLQPRVHRDYWSCNECWADREYLMSSSDKRTDERT